MKLVVLVLVTLLFICCISSPVLADTHANITVIAQGLVVGPQPPSNFIITTTENTSGNTSFWCLNLSWTKGMNSPYTIITICRDEVMDCPNKSVTNLSPNCMVLYNGNGTNLSSCGWQFDYYKYSLLAWGSDNTGNWSLGCTKISLDGGSMLNLVLFIGWMVLALGLTFLALKVRMILFRLAASLSWVGLGMLLLLGKITNLSIGDTWTQVLGFVFILMAIAILLLQMVMEVQTEKGGHVYKEWVRSRKEAGPSRSYIAKMEYKRKLQDAKSRGMSKR